MLSPDRKPFDLFVTDKMRLLSLNSSVVETQITQSALFIDVPWEKIPETERWQLRALLELRSYYPITDQRWIQRNEQIEPKALQTVIALQARSSGIPYSELPESKQVSRFQKLNPGIGSLPSTLGFMMHILGAHPNENKTQWIIPQDVDPDSAVLKYLVAFTERNFPLILTVNHGRNSISFPIQGPRKETLIRSIQTAGIDLSTTDPYSTSLEVSQKIIDGFITLLVRSRYERQEIKNVDSANYASFKYTGISLPQQLD